MTIGSIFDGLTHPSLEDLKCWSKIKPVNYSLSVHRALAVSLPTLVSAEEEFEYIECALNTDHFYPVISIDPRNDDIEKKIHDLHASGCVGIKIHPRFLNWDWTAHGQEIHLHRVAKALVQTGCTLFFCTYFASRAALYPKQNPLSIFAVMLAQYSNLKMVLIHSGGPNLLEYIEFARFNENILLDLSYAPVKFANSSYTLDLRYALEYFDKRVSFGSDWPYVSHQDAIASLAKQLPCGTSVKQGGHLHGVWGTNLKTFLGL